MARDAAALVGGDPRSAERGPARECPGRAGPVVLGPAGPAETCSKPRAPISGWSIISTTTRSMKAVLSPPALSRPWNVIVCDPGVEIMNEVVVSFLYEVLSGVMVSTTTPSISTWKASVGLE